MNSVQLANKAWSVLRHYSLVDVYHIPKAVQDAAIEQTPNFVIEIAIKRLEAHLIKLKQLMKELQKTPKKWPRYQEILKQIDELSMNGVQEGEIPTLSE